PSNRGNLDFILAPLTIIGGPGNNLLNINDTGKRGNVDFKVTPTQVVDDTSDDPGPGRSTFAGITYDRTIQRLRLTVGQGHHTLTVTPSLHTTYALFGRGVNRDSLEMDFAGTRGARLTRTRQGGV